ncbi:MAG: hypothetical protein JWP29_2838 [Rhodoferax sp.]|nr:hypothetical protein [Rhodoferax sp.]
MNTSSKILASSLIAVASLSAASAFAGDNDYPGVQASAASTVSNTTRAQVRAEYLQAKREGTLIQSDDAYPVVAAQASGKTRAEVQAELGNARRAGLTDRIDNSYPGDVAQGGVNGRTQG